MLGRRLRLPGVNWDTTIVGVAPPGLAYPPAAPICAPTPSPCGPPPLWGWGAVAAPPAAPAARLDMIRLASAPPAITAGLTLFTVMLFGLLPALGATRFDLSPQLRADTRSGTEGRRLRGVRRTLVASQMALALVLLAGAGLLMR